VARGGGVDGATARDGGAVARLREETTTAVLWFNGGGARCECGAGRRRRETTVMRGGWRRYEMMAARGEWRRHEVGRWQDNTSLPPELYTPGTLVPVGNTNHD
jgi:hypothetical protein